MSIRLTQSIFNSAGAFVPVDGATINLNPALEASLVSGGKAVYVSNPSQGGRVPVESEFNTVTGKNTFSAAGIEIPINPLSDTGMPSQLSRAGFVPSRVIATGEDGIGVAGGWSVGLGTLASDTVNARRPGTSVLKATANAGAVDMVVRHAIPAIALTGGLEFFVKVPRPTVGTINLMIGWGATAPGADPVVSQPANVRVMYMGNQSEYAQGGWAAVKVHPQISHYGTGRQAGRAWYSTEAVPSTVRYIEILFQFSVDVPAGERDCYVDMVAVNGTVKPMVVIGFDGFYSSIASIAMPLMNKAGVKGYNSSSGNNIAGNKATCDALYDAGWDLIQQAQRSADYGLVPTNLAADIDSARAQFDAAGYTRARDIFAYPYNSRSAATDAILASKGFHCARATGDGGFVHSQLGNGGLLGVGCMSLNNATAAQSNAWVDAAILNGTHMWMCGHNLVGSITDAGTQMLTTEFTTALAYMVDKHCQGAIEIVTPSEFLARVY